MLHSVEKQRGHRILTSSLASYCLKWLTIGTSKYKPTNFRISCFFLITIGHVSMPRGICNMGLDIFHH